MTEQIAQWNGEKLVIFCIILEEKKTPFTDQGILPVILL